MRQYEELYNSLRAIKTGIEDVAQICGCHRNTLRNVLLLGRPSDQTETIVLVTTEYISQHTNNLKEKVRAVLAEA